MRRLTSLNPPENRWRAYEIELKPTLVGDVAVAARWGRIGTDGQEKIEHFASREESRRKVRHLVRRRRQRGYDLLSEGRSLQLVEPQTESWATVAMSADPLSTKQFSRRVEAFRPVADCNLTTVPGYQRRQFLDYWVDYLAMSRFYQTEDRRATFGAIGGTTRRSHLYLGGKLNPK